MAAKEIELEVERALECIECEKNFILTGGAGSGKTYSLISLIEEIGNKYPLSSIVCITYTNNAVAEIRDRITNSNLRVSTIHEFVWSIISEFQREIKETLIELVNEEEKGKFKQPKELDDGQKIGVDYFNDSNIVYGGYYDLKKHEVSSINHDQVLILAEKMFEKYSKLCDILKDIAKFIFVDEYQDTSPLIKEILLKHLKQSSKKNTVGFFGDSMQAIYDGSVGAITDGSLVRIDKKQNRRNPQTVIDLANLLREDEIEQVPSDDLNAPNMDNGIILQGSIKFVYADSIDGVNSLRNLPYFKDWNFYDSKQTKELWLVQKANAKRAGFPKLFELYNSDKIIELIDRTQKKVIHKGIETSNRTFESVTEEADVWVKKRGNLLENIRADSTYSSVFERIKANDWDKVSNYRVNKESLLSYKFNGLMGKYESRPQRDKILCHLDSIYELMELYENGVYNDFLRKTEKNIITLKDKVNLKEGMDQLANRDLTIGQCIDRAEIILNIQNDPFETFIKDRGVYLWQRIKELPFSEYVRSIEYQKEYLPFATQHSIKGSEFDNVLVVLDNGNWHNYNFETLFKEVEVKDTVITRTKKLFYVCCTRAKKNLCVFMPTSDTTVIENAKELFGEDNVFHCG